MLGLFRINRSKTLIMRALILLPLFLLASLAFSNSLNSLVFDLSADIKTILPDDGWVKLSFSVTNFGEQDLNVQFSAVCIESGLELPYYPQNIKLTLKPDAEQSITVFMNDQCGQLENLPPGRHSRTIQYKFVDLRTREELSFEQPYIIEVPVTTISR